MVALLQATHGTAGNFVQLIREDGSVELCQLVPASLARQGSLSAALLGNSPSVPPINQWTYLLAGNLALDVLGAFWALDTATGKLTYSGPAAIFLVTLGPFLAPAPFTAANTIALYLDKNDTFVGTTNNPTGPQSQINLDFAGHAFPQFGGVNNLISLATGDTLTGVYRQDNPQDFALGAGSLTIIPVG